MIFSNALRRLATPAQALPTVQELPTHVQWAPPSLSGQAFEQARARTDPISIETRPGEANDRLDTLPLVKEGETVPDIKERILEDAKTNPAIAPLLELFHFDKPDPERMRAYVDLGIGEALAELMARFGIHPGHVVADVGCGLGWLAFSLDRLGYSNLVAMDPKTEATNYLRKVAGDRIEVINDLDVWRGIRHRFDALVSVATVHHWEHIPWIALEARRTVKPGAYWFAVMEQFADTPAEFVQLMSTHPTRERYKAYEWAYPVSAYVDLIQSVGFTLTAVVPMYYRGNAYLTVRPLLPTPGGLDQAELDQLVDENLTGPNGTVELFWAEVDARRRTPGWKLFTRPQVLVFQRTVVD